jgi:GT2 family glycosyltransferase
MNKLAICIPVYNQWAYTKRAIQDLSVLPENHKLFIVDNGSSDNTKNLFSSGKIQVIRNTKNLGFAIASNQAFAQAVELGYENVMFLNNDIRIQKPNSVWTEPLLQAAQEGYIVGPTAGSLDNQFNFICESSKLPTKGYGYISGWNITASVATWKRLVLNGDVGPFNTKFISYFEDTDLSLRAQKMGIGLKIIDVPVRHIGRVTGTSIGLSDLYKQSKKTFMDIWEKIHE